VLVLRSHYAGSVCGRSLSGDPLSSIGFERGHNGALVRRDEYAFAAGLVADAPPPAHHAAIVDANRKGRSPAPA
jgi:hydroxyacylglutathione hydrolase